MISKIIKPAVLGGCILALMLWAGSSILSGPASAMKDDPKGAKAATEDYVGSEACKDCHEDQFKAYSHTSHAQLSSIGSWKG
jgi:hypothetical protein